MRLFAACRERARADEIALDLPNDSVRLEELKDALSAACPELGPLVRISRVAVNQAFATADDLISASDEVALIPPVSGGSGLELFGIRAGPLSLQEVIAAVERPEAGAICSFAGTVRNRTGEHDVSALEYEAYEEMAERFLRSIGSEIAEKWPGAKAAVLHRVGKLEIGDVAVVIAVSSPHRAQAFEACRHAIERIKEDVPIWKKELRKDGSVWVGTGS